MFRLKIDRNNILTVIPTLIIVLTFVARGQRSVEQKKMKQRKRIRFFIQSKCVHKTKQNKKITIHTNTLSQAYNHQYKLNLFTKK